MAVKPESYAEWATNEVTETKIINGITRVIKNKLEPDSEFKNTGYLFQEEPNRQHFNYHLNLIDLWVKHLDARYSIGDVHLTTSGESIAAISERLGGTWESRGTQSVGTITTFVYEKTA